MSKYSKRLIAVLFILLVTVFIALPAQAQEGDEQPVARAVLFYSPTCPHCEDLIQNFLPPLLDEYGDHLKIVAVNVSIPAGQALYQAAIDHYAIPDDRLGVPTLIINDQVMVGGVEIPAQFPGIVTETLAGGGADWPSIPGLAEVVAGIEFSSRPSGNPQDGDIQEEPLTMVDKFMRDPVANTLAVVVLVGMLACLIGVLARFTRPAPDKDFWPKWSIPLFAVLGVGVAFYMTYIETSGVEAVCGPVGDCNAVQLSPYATLFGFLPVGVLGLIGYALILIAWAVYTFGPQTLRWVSAIALWGMAFFGVLFSIYLTFLEPFVIGASCLWCISSAIIITLVFLAATNPAKRAWQEDDDFDEEDLIEEEAEVVEESEEPIQDAISPASFVENQSGEDEPTETESTSSADETDWPPENETES